MAISLQQVEKKNRQRRKKATAKKATPKKASKTTTKKTTVKVEAARELKKPWQMDPSQDFVKGKRTRSKKAPMSEAEQQSFSRPEMHQNWLFDNFRNHSISELINSETLQNLGEEVLTKLQRRSYLLSKATHVADWVRSIEVSPKVKIPVPSILSHRERPSKK